MINVNDFKTGMTIKYEGNLFMVIEFQHVKPGKGAAFVRTKLKNLRTGATIEITFNSATKVELARIEKKPMQFLYANGDDYVFMNMNDYSQVELNAKVLGDDTKFLKENLDVDTITFSPSFTNKGILITIPVSSVASFIALLCVLPFTPGSVLTTSISILSGR